MSNSRSRTFSSLAALVLCFAFAAPVRAGSPEGDKKKLVAALKDFQKLKKREATVQTVLRRASAAQAEKYEIEYKALKPKIYDAAQRMELAVQSYERNHGRKALCEVVTGDLRTFVPVCLKK